MLVVNIRSTKSEISAQREIVNRHNDPGYRVIEKCQRIAGLEALLKEWELSDNLDHDYIRGLKARLLSVKNQLKNMSGVTDQTQRTIGI